MSEILERTARQAEKISDRKNNTTWTDIFSSAMSEFQIKLCCTDTSDLGCYRGII